MRVDQLDTIYRKGILDKRQYLLLRAIYGGSLISLHSELRTLLYASGLLLVYGAGVLIYRYAGEVIHLVNLAAISGGAAGCFFYARKKREPYTNAATVSPNTYYDYVVVLGCLLVGTLVTYLQARYQVFGEHLALPAGCTGLFYFFCAYYFDNRAVLAMAIVTTASAVGLQATLGRWFASNAFVSSELILPSVLYGLFSAGSGLLLDRRGIKRHFTFNYLLWGALFGLSGLLAALFSYDFKIVWFVLLAAACGFSIHYALRRVLYIFFLLGVVFGYAGITYALSRLVDWDSLFWYLYFLISSTGLIIFIKYSIKDFGKN